MLSTSIPGAHSEFVDAYCVLEPGVRGSPHLYAWRNNPCYCSRRHFAFPASFLVPLPCSRFQLFWSHFSSPHNFGRPSTVELVSRMQIRAIRTIVERVSRTHVCAMRTTFDRVSRSQIRAAVGIPIAAVTVVLTTLALTAARNPGFIEEDYHILSPNTSTLGQNLVPTPTSGGTDPSPTSCGPL